VEAAHVKGPAWSIEERGENWSFRKSPPWNPTKKKEAGWGGGGRDLAPPSMPWGGKAGTEGKTGEKKKSCPRMEPHAQKKGVQSRV